MPDDGRIHLTRVELDRIELTHVWSAPDNEVRETLLADRIHCRLGGFTEWQGRHPAGLVSIGWTWFLRDDGEAELAPGLIGTNLMVIGAHGEPLGRETTGRLLRARITTIGWPAEVRAALVDDWPRSS